MCNCFVSVVLCNREETGWVCVLAACSGKVDSKDRARSRISEQELVVALGKAILFPQ